jgi:DNA-directed RNA polymerase I, II, and III subunit RPABC1
MTSIRSLWMSYRTVMQMLNDRKYILSQPLKFINDEEDKDQLTITDDGYPDFAETLPDFLKYFGIDTQEELSVNDESSIKTTLQDALKIKVSKKDDADPVIVSWCNVLGKPNISNIKVDAANENVQRWIIIVQSKITPYVPPTIRNLEIQGIVIETFMESDLQYNVTHHEFVPRHIICSAATKKEIFEKYSITKKQLPIIKKSDAQVRYLGARKGNLIKIIRPSDSMPKSKTVDGEVKEFYDITFRIVI